MVLTEEVREAVMIVMAVKMAIVWGQRDLEEASIIDFQECLTIEMGMVVYNGDTAHTGMTLKS